MQDSATLVPLSGPSEMASGRTQSLPVFVRRNARALAFGALHAFFSAPGQTICIGVFVASFAASLGLTIADVGALYLAATIASGTTFLLVGHWIDRIPMRTFSTASIVALAVACSLMAVAPNALGLALALFALRLAGQGLMVHIEATATARSFTIDRGRALGITALGLSFAEAVVPSLALVSLDTIGWRGAYAAVAVLLLCAVLPLSRALAGEGADRAPVALSARPPRFWTGAVQLASNWRAWILLPGLAIVPFLATSLMFNIASITASQGWPASVLAVGFPVMAAASVASLMISGRLIDRYSAGVVFALHAVPILLGLVALALVPSPWVVPVMMALIGLSGGAAKTTATALWAEIFGTAQLGAVRSAVMMYLVLASAVAPFAYGALVGAGWTMSGALLLFAAGGLMAAAPSLLAFRSDFRGPP